MGAKLIGTEHLLVALLRETDSVAARLVFSMGFSAEKFNQDIQAIYRRGQDGGQPDADGEAVEALRQCAVMLLNQDGRGRQEGHLL